MHPGATIEIRFEWENDDHVVNTMLNPFHAAWSPSPHLGGDIIEHPATGRFGHTGKMKIKPRIINQDNKVPRFGLQHPSDRANTLNHPSDCGQADQTHHIQLWHARDHGDSGRFHTCSPDPNQFRGRVLRGNRFGQMGAMEIPRGFTGDNQNSWHECDKAQAEVEVDASCAFSRPDP
jgi:hypothetical protein